MSKKSKTVVSKTMENPVVEISDVPPVRVKRTYTQDPIKVQARKEFMQDLAERKRAYKESIADLRKVRDAVKTERLIRLLKNRGFDVALTPLPSLGE